MKYAARAARRFVPAIEPLESRIAPATLHGNVLTYTDIDGDHVTIKITHATLTASMFTFDTGSVNGDNMAKQQLQLIDLTTAGAGGANITMSVKKAVGGDGLANVGRIDASGANLGNVSILGDLGEIDSGSGTPQFRGLHSLTVRSMGSYGHVTDVSGDLESNILGGLGTLTVSADVSDAFINVAGGGGLVRPELGTIGSIHIGGSLLGGAGAQSGSIFTTGDIGKVSIAGDLRGGAGASTAEIFSGGKIGNVTLGGSLIGGQLTGAGAIFSTGDLGTVSIRHNVEGNLGDGTGIIRSSGKIAGVTIGGSLIGGGGVGSGEIISAGDLGPVKIMHNAEAGAGKESGKIDSGGMLASVTIGGSLLGGSGDEDTFKDANMVTHGGQIFSLGDMGAVKIGHDVKGSSGVSSGQIESSGKLASLTLGGSLIGGTNSFAGEIGFNNTTGLVKIGGNVLGGSASFSGQIQANGTFMGLIIGGSLIGGSASLSGQLQLNNDGGVLRIGQNLIGGAGAISGAISGNAHLDSLTLGGSLIGGSASSSGEISVDDVGTVTIGHNIIGGSVSGSASIEATGLLSLGHAGSLTIGGSLIAGTDDSTGTLTDSGVVEISQDIGAITVKGSLLGNSTPNGTTFAKISALGKTAVAGDTTDVAIGKIAIGGRVELAKIFAGSDPEFSTKNADAQIGSVTVGGDWAASSIVAGAVNFGADDAPGGTGANADNVNFGDQHDAKVTGADLPGIVSKIGSITICGRAFGAPSSFTGGPTSFGFVAEEIDALKIGGRAFVLDAGPNNDGIPLMRLQHMTLHEIDALGGLPAMSFPAAKLVGKNTVVYTDIDGDHVTVTLSKPLLTAGNVNSVFFFNNSSVGGANTSGQQLQDIDLAALATNGLGLTVSVTPGVNGDGLANIGAIDSTGFDLGAVVIPGDLGKVVAGSGVAGATALASLTVRSLGRMGTDTQPAIPMPGLDSDITGNIGSLVVKQDIAGASVETSQVGDSIHSISIGGSLIGQPASVSGDIITSTIGTIKIGRDLQGGSADGSGGISASQISSVSIGGSVIGSKGVGSGQLSSNDNLGSVTIAHDVIGNLGTQSGIVTFNKTNNVTIRGSVFGGAGSRSGNIDGALTTGAVKIGHDLSGGSGNDSGKIDSSGSVGAISIGGSLIGGVGNQNSYNDGVRIHEGQIFAVQTIGKVKIGRDEVGNASTASGEIFTLGGLAGVSIGGSLVGALGDFSGSILSDTAVGVITVGGDLFGGGGASAGLIQAGGALTSIGILGSIVGGSGTNNFSGDIVGGSSIGMVAIGSDVTGGAGGASGGIEATGAVGRVTIGGSLVGGTSSFSGVITGGSLGTVAIVDDLIGASVMGTQFLSQTGYITTGGAITKVTLGGSIISGIDNSTQNTAGGDLQMDGSIRAGETIGTLTVKGSLIGNVNPNGATPVVISAAGPASLNAPNHLAIASIVIGGRLEHANIFGAYQTDLTALDGAGIGSVKVGRDWIASNLVADVQNTGANAGTSDDNINFGDAHDFYGGIGLPGDRIASVVIGGLVRGTAASGDHFGFSSLEIGAFKSLNYTAPLHTGQVDIIELSPLTGDVTIRETL